MNKMFIVVVSILVIGYADAKKRSDRYKEKQKICRENKNRTQRKIRNHIAKTVETRIACVTDDLKTMTLSSQFSSAYKQWRISKLKRWLVEDHDQYTKLKKPQPKIIKCKRI